MIVKVFSNLNDPVVLRTNLGRKEGGRTRHKITLLSQFQKNELSPVQGSTN